MRIFNWLKCRLGLHQWQWGYAYGLRKFCWRCGASKRFKK